MKQCIIPAVAAMVAVVMGLGLNSSSAADVKWLTNYDQARKTAAAESKPMLIMFTASWCGPCRNMKNTTLSDKTVEGVISKNFIPVMIDTDANPTVTRKFRVNAMPTIMVVDASTEVVEQVQGYKAKGEFLTFLNRNKSDLHLASSTKPGTQPLKQAIHQDGQKSGLLTPYCLVTILKEGKLETGKPEFSTTHTGHTLQFASAEKRAEFLKNPQTFWPELQGNCPVSWKDSGSEVRGEARWAVEYEGQLFLCHTKEHAEKFLKDPSRYAAKEAKPVIQQTTNKTTVIN